MRTIIALPKDTRIAYRDHLRDARARAFSDAEGFQEVLFAIEHLGTALLSKASTLNVLRENYAGLLKHLLLRFAFRQNSAIFILHFDVLYRIVRVARNDALHQGAYARHIDGSHG